MRHRLFVTALSLSLAVSLASVAQARLKIVVPQELRQSALACLGEALRLCPNALSAKDRGLSCVVAKRRLLSRRCQSVYDQGVQLLKGHDVRVTVGPPKAP
jgi:hypothetical protein